ncbi:MAG: hypothetical protein PHO34_00115 [Candidatus Omnitrophica bacterium]|nr:hypothetical protein [Candidatus Omnitrophota bacterium]MDD5042313.1 hypothetical protein [Candidatus Omnitrophota bacterium]MDD5500462.1 hypothetical protein [Candidatus Omnitrophota bacterium]
MASDIWQGDINIKIISLKSLGIFYKDSVLYDLSNFLDKKMTCYFRSIIVSFLILVFVSHFNILLCILFLIFVWSFVFIYIKGISKKEEFYWSVFFNNRKVKDFVNHWSKEGFSVKSVFAKALFEFKKRDLLEIRNGEWVCPFCKTIQKEDYRECLNCGWVVENLF